MSSVPGNAVPSGREPVRMSCLFGVSPRPLTTSPFSVSDVCLPSLFVPCNSSRLFATTSPFALRQGPLPIRSRALTAPGPCVLRYACHVLSPAPAAAASVWQCLSAPANPPKSPPLPEPVLVMKNDMPFDAVGAMPDVDCCVIPVQPATSTAIDAATPRVIRVICDFSYVGRHLAGCGLSGPSST